MLRQTKDLQDLAIHATDGAIGDVKDLYFDDEAWAIRYLVVDTGSWLFSRKVLISPIAAGKADWLSKTLPVSLTREQVKNAPDIDTDKPLTRQHESSYLDYYNYPYYWGGMGLWGSAAYPSMLMSGYGGDDAGAGINAETDRVQAIRQDRERDADPHLRSCKAVAGYHIVAIDGEIGHVQGLLVDEDSWAIRYLVVRTSNWWMGHEVLLAPQSIRQMSWAEQTVSVDLTREALRQAPAYDPSVPLTREMETAVYQHYGWAGHWPGAASASDQAATARSDG